LFLGGGLNVEINQFLTIDNGDTEFFRLCRIEEHAFHLFSGSSARKHAATKRPGRQRLSVIGLRHVWDEGKGD
jgi:hypothetical protein